MSRSPINYTAQTTQGAGIVGASVLITTLQGNNANVTTDQIGLTPADNPLTTDSHGQISGWLETGTYVFTLTGVDLPTTEVTKDVIAAADIGQTTTLSMDLDQLGLPTNDVNFNSVHLINVADPVAPQQAATKAYVDDWTASNQATTTSLGAIQLAGDLGGIGTTATAPVISEGAITADKIANTTITDAQVATANTDGLAALASLRTLGTGSQQAMAGNTRLDQIASPTATLNFNNQLLIGIADPVNPQDGATKHYVDTRIGVTLDAIPLATHDVNINTHKLTNVVDPAGAQDAATKHYVDVTIGGGASPASTSAAGIVQLAGDLGGTGTTYTAPVITNSAVTIAKIDQSVWTTVMASGTLAARPAAAAGNAGYMYVATDTGGGTLYASTGSAWQQASLGATATAGGDLTGSYPNPTIGSAAVTSSKIASGTVTGTNIASGTITGSNIASATITTSQVAPNTLLIGNIAQSVWDSNAIQKGLDASKPVASSSNAGFLYFSTDIVGGTLYRSTGSAWDQLTIGLTGAGTVKKFAQTIGDGATTVFTITHSLGTQDVEVQIYAATTPFLKLDPNPAINFSSTNTVTLTFGTAPTTNQYRVVVLG